MLDLDYTISSTVPIDVATYQLKEVVERTVKEFEMKKKEKKNNKSK